MYWKKIEKYSTWHIIWQTENKMFSQQDQPLLFLKTIYQSQTQKASK